MSREKEFNKVKELIKENIDDARCGIFDCRNMAGDHMTTLFEGKYFTLDWCFYWAYYEVFGATDKEFKELEEYYYELLDNE